MRFTVKAKLASAFGAIIILSAITGAVAYINLSELAATSRTLVGRGERLDKAAQLQAAILNEANAQKNMILASSDAEITHQADEIKKLAGEARQLHDVINASTNEHGKELMAKFASEYDKATKIEDETIRLAKQHSADRANQYWRTDGAAVVKTFNDAVDAALAKLDRTPASVETLKANSALQIARTNLERTGKLLRDAFAASDVNELNAALGALKDQLGALSNAAQQAAAAVGDSGNEIIAASEKLTKAYQHAAEIVGEGGDIRAASMSKTDGQAAVGAALAVVTEYIEYVRKVMAQDAVDSAQQAAQAETVLIGAVLVSLLVAIGSAVWIALNISRGLGRAVGLAEAVAIGDLSQRIAASSDDEVGDLVKALNTMTLSLNETAKLAETIAAGDLTVEAKRLSDKDTLGIALEKMLDKLSGVVSEAVSAAQNVSAGSQQLSASAEQLSQGATEQASSTEEASSSMEEMAANVKQSADNASQTEKIARQSALDAEASGQAVTHAVKAMETIAEKITIVQEIARQTDLLALNAAVEAARAGRARSRLCGRRLRSAQARRAQPGGGGRDRHAVERHRQVGPRGGSDAGQTGARHQAHRRSGRRNHRREPRAGRRRDSDQPGDPAARPGDAAERGGVGRGLGDLGRADGAGRAAAADDLLLPHRRYPWRAAGDHRRCGRPCGVGAQGQGDDDARQGAQAACRGRSHRQDAGQEGRRRQGIRARSARQ